MSMSATTTGPAQSFTPDSKLELLFSPDLIPDSVRNALPAELHIRPLASTDYHRGHLRILEVLTLAPDVGAARWTEQFTFMRAASPPVYYSLVIVDRKSDAVVAVGTVFLERKFLRGLGVVGHIEDIAVDKSQQGKKLGLRVIQALTGISERQGAYKTILNCSTANVPFYEKCGYVQKENEMAKYAPERTDSPRL